MRFCFSFYSRLSPASVNTYLFTIKSVWGLHAKSGKYKDVAKNIVKARFKYKRKKSPTRDQLNIMMQYLGDCKKKNKTAYRNYIFFRVLSFYGLRISEGLKLKLSDIYRTDEEIKLNIIGKGNKPRTGLLPLYQVDDNGNKKIIPIYKAFHDDLVYYIENVWPQFPKPYKTQWHMFYSRNGNVWNDDSARLAFKQTCKKTDLKGFTPHSLRHAFVSHKLADGVPLQTVSKLVDHSNASITASIYAHSEEADLLDGMTKGISLG